MRNTLSLILAAAVTAAPVQAQVAPAFETDAIASVAPDDPTVTYIDIGDQPSADEAALRGGNYYVIVVGGVVWGAIKSCASNSACRTLANAVLKGLAKAGAKAYYGSNREQIDAQLCRAKISRFC
jgi:hypothetical protein